MIVVIATAVVLVLLCTERIKIPEKRKFQEDWEKSFRLGGWPTVSVGYFFLGLMGISASSEDSYEIMGHVIRVCTVF